MKLKLLLFLSTFVIISGCMEQQNKTCPICFENLYQSHQDVITLACHKTHKFHLYCIAGWNKKQRTCPNCRVSTQSTENDPARLSNYILDSEHKHTPETETGCLAALGIRISFYTIG